ncbi:hypothetical protein B0J18DRAFT_295348 [Chaetomium sp. MPI-SDFR-AT-0129]|nr:hypothetical protein B0J18DRAFT_295348 [Chaetomium sp. MPI-SDFR-AT-0129]
MKRQGNKKKAKQPARPLVTLVTGVPTWVRQTDRKPGKETRRTRTKRPKHYFRYNCSTKPRHPEHQSSNNTTRHIQTNMQRKTQQNTAKHSKTQQNTAGKEDSNKQQRHKQLKMTNKPQSHVPQTKYPSLAVPVLWARVCILSLNKNATKRGYLQFPPVLSCFLLKCCCFLQGAAVFFDLRAQPDESETDNSEREKQAAMPSVLNKPNTTEWYPVCVLVRWTGRPAVPNCQKRQTKRQSRSCHRGLRKEGVPNQTKPNPLPKLASQTSLPN